MSGVCHLRITSLGLIDSKENGTVRLSLKTEAVCPQELNFRMHPGHWFATRRDKLSGIKILPPTLTHSLKKSV